MGTRLFIADDDPTMRDLLRSLLESEEGFVVTGEAGDGLETVELVLADPPEVLLLAVAMPKMNGIEVARRIRTERPQVRIVVVSMHALRSFVRSLLEIGVSAYVLKNKVTKEIVPAVNQVLAGQIYLSPEIAALKIQK